MNEDKESSNDKVTMLNVVQSTLAAAIGVQSEKNRQRDFKKGKPIEFTGTCSHFLMLSSQK